MLKDVIEQDTDLKVELTQGVGCGTSNIEPGMESGKFDLYPESHRHRMEHGAEKERDVFGKSVLCTAARI